jgi:O-antigen ligase
MKILERIIEWGIYLFIFLLPWQTRLILREGSLNGYWEYGTISIYATEIFLWVIFILTAAWWIINKFKDKNFATEENFLRTKKSVFIYLFIFIIWSFISFFWADSKILAVYVWHWFAEAAGLFLILRVKRFNIAKLVWAFVFSALIQAGLGIWQFLSQTTFASKWLGIAMHNPAISGTVVVETAFRRWLRAYGGLPHPNILAGFLAIAMFLIFWLYQKTNYGFKKLILPAIFSILSLGLFATFSKSVILSFLAALILLWFAFFIFRQSRKPKIDLLKFTLIFLVIAGIFTIIFWEPVETRISGVARLEVKSSTERLDYFDQAWELIKNHPFLGVVIILWLCTTK